MLRNLVMLGTRGDARKADATLWAGRYELGERLGAGGLATVYRGRLVGPAGFSRPVAMKRLHAHLVRHADAAMFLDEARIASCIVHPNVVATLDVVAEAGEYVVVMELVDGATLEQLVARGAPPVAVTLRVVSDVLRGLHAAHEARDANGEALAVVHRDVAPSNVLVGRDGVARIGDFGVAKARGRLASTRNGEVKGHLSYMAPEQLAGEDVDARADTFAAGVVLWEALTGRRLFHGENEAQVIYALLERPIASPRVTAPHLSADLEAVVLRALERDAGKRFSTAAAMADALEAAGTMATREDVAAWVAAHRGAGEGASDIPSEAVAADTWLDAPAAVVPRRPASRGLRAAVAVAIGLGLVVAATAGATLRPASPSVASSPAPARDVPALPPPAVAPAAVTALAALPPVVSEPAPSPRATSESQPRRTSRPSGPRSSPRRATPVRLYARD